MLCFVLVVDCRTCVYGVLILKEVRYLQQTILNLVFLVYYSIDDYGLFMFVYDEKTDQLAYRTKELGKDGACRNDNSLGLQNGKVEPLAQDVMHSGDDHIPSLEDRDDGKTNYTETSINHHENLNVKDEDIMLVDGTDITSQSEKSVVQDQDHKDISCAYTGITFSANNSGEQNEDPMDLKFSNDDLDVPVEDIKNISYTDTTVNSDILESKQIKPMSYTSRHVHTVDSHNMQAEDLDGFAYSGPSIHVHEQDQGLQSIGNTIMNGVGRCVNNVPSEKCHPEMNAVIVDQEQDENIRIMPLNSSSVLSVSSREQVFVDDFLDPNDQAGKDEKYVWHLSGPLDSLYQPADNRTYSDTGGSQIKHGHLSAVQHDSAIYLQNDVLRRQQAQVTVASVLPVDNSASFVQPCSNRQSNGQLQIIAEDNGMLPSSHECRNVPKQSTDLLSVVNNRLAQFTSFSTAMEGHQLIDRSHNGRYMQQIQKNLYPGVRFPTKGNSPIVEQQSFAACRSLDRRYNLFPVDQSHNLSGLGSNNCLTQALPGGSNIDGSLFSALVQYEQPLAHLQSGGLSSSQLPEIRNQDDPAQSFVPTHDINSAVPNTYAYSQTLPTSQSSQVASLGSLNSMGWTNSIQQNPGMPNFMNRQFRGPWTR